MGNTLKVRQTQDQHIKHYLENFENLARGLDSTPPPMGNRVKAYITWSILDFYLKHTWNIPKAYLKHTLSSAKAYSWFYFNTFDPFLTMYDPLVLLHLRNQTMGTNECTNEVSSEYLWAAVTAKKVNFDQIPGNI